MKRLFWILMGVLVCFSSTAYSLPISVPAINGWDGISGADMTGMLVTEKINGIDVVKTWANIAGNKYGVSGTDWELSFSNENTFEHPWSLSVTNSALQSLTIDAFAGGVVFDIIYSDYENLSTPGSENGNWWENAENFGTTSGRNSYFEWTFSDMVGLGTAAPVGDLFGTLKLDFTGKSTLPADYAFFYLDTDIVTTVPEPSTIVLLFVGIFGLFGIIGIKRKNI